MTINPDHLFEQAERLARPRAGAPRQVDLRRAISSAYYGVFHGILSEAADEFVGNARRGTPRYNLVYRKTDHGALRKLCLQVDSRSNIIVPYSPGGGFEQRIGRFAQQLLELYQRRNSADYDPSYRVRRVDAVAAIKLARSALAQFRDADPDHRTAFLTLLLFPPR